MIFCYFTFYILISLCSDDNGNDLDKSNDKSLLDKKPAIYINKVCNFYDFKNQIPLITVEVFENSSTIVKKENSLDLKNKITAEKILELDEEFSGLECCKNGTFWMMVICVLLITTLFLLICIIAYMFY